MWRLTHSLSSPPARIPLRSQHLRCMSSRPAEFNINYRQDVTTLCMDTNKSDSEAAHYATRAHTWSMKPKWLLRILCACKPSRSLPSVTTTGLPPSAFSASSVLIRPIGFAPPPPTPLNLNQVVILDSAYWCVMTEPHRVSPYSSISMSVAPGELLSSDETLTASRELIKSKKALLLSRIPFSVIPAHLPTVGNHCCCAACLRIESTPCSIIARLHYKRHWCQAADYFPDLLQCSNGGITVPSS